MATTTQLREQRASIWEQMKAIMDGANKEGRSLTAEETQTYDRLEKDLDTKGDEITRSEAFDKHSEEFAKVDRSGVVAPDNSTDELGDEPAKGYTEAFNRYMRNGIQALDHEDRTVLQKGFVKGPSNAQGVGTGAAGGYTVPRPSARSSSSG